MKTSLDIISELQSMIRYRDIKSNDHLSLTVDSDLEGLIIGHFQNLKQTTNQTNILSPFVSVLYLCYPS